VLPTCKTASTKPQTQMGTSSNDSKQ